MVNVWFGVFFVVISRTREHVIQSLHGISSIVQTAKRHSFIIRDVSEV